MYAGEMVVSLATSSLDPPAVVSCTSRLQAPPQARDVGGNMQYDLPEWSRSSGVRLAASVTGRKPFLNSPLSFPE